MSCSHHVPSLFADAKGDATSLDVQMYCCGSCTAVCAAHRSPLPLMYSGRRHRGHAGALGDRDMYSSPGSPSRYMQGGRAVVVPVEQALGYSLCQAYLCKHEWSDDPLLSQVSKGGGE